MDGFEQVAVALIVCVRVFLVVVVVWIVVREIRKSGRERKP
jgi:uncharacterized membrane-anchored protein